MSDIKKEYFGWLCDMIDTKAHPVRNYRTLLLYLHSVDFRYILPMDENRFEDGIDLRYRFGYEKGYVQPELDRLIPKPCSVFEMIVALALRCEENIMADPEYGDRTGIWFWESIESLGLIEMTNKRFDEEYVYYVLDRFLDREYEPNGRGGLVTLENPPRDMRDVEIWAQMMWKF